MGYWSIRNLQIASIFLAAILVLPGCVEEATSDCPGIELQETSFFDTGNLQAVETSVSSSELARAVRCYEEMSAEPNGASIRYLRQMVNAHDENFLVFSIRGTMNQRIVFQLDDSDEIVAAHYTYEPLYKETVEAE